MFRNLIKGYPWARVCFGFSLFFSLLLVAGTAQAVESKKIRLLTTSSTSNSGLMAILKPAFEAKTGYRLEVEAFGTGWALRMAAVGKADVIITHAPAAEKGFMAAGFGHERHYVMRNAFVIVGPASDPAGIRDSGDAKSALRRIAETKSAFISRGDDSGTHKKELDLWESAGLEPFGGWYVEYGHNMGKTLRHANEQQAYTLVDNGTWLAKRDNLKLQQLYQGEDSLNNPYHVISISPKLHPDNNHKGASAFVKWLLSDEAQRLIGDYKVDNEVLFMPAR
ncbi:substrate-binding domain-containing protein [Maricurvus nonylphenolicus]|uniref:substrate-binding domain-containing protein n=1 Tax=Maricurvus nonylphenolicus TaxID=1008307 RepID=UPI0036F2B937